MAFQTFGVQRPVSSICLVVLLYTSFLLPHCHGAGRGYGTLQTGTPPTLIHHVPPPHLNASLNNYGHTNSSLENRNYDYRGGKSTTLNVTAPTSVHEILPSKTIAVNQSNRFDASLRNGTNNDKH